MAAPLAYTMFHDVLFPPARRRAGDRSDEELFLQKVIRYLPGHNLVLDDTTLVVFDFETTGLDSNDDRIIEIGALKLHRFEVVGEFTTLIDPGMTLTDQVAKLTGISNDMLKGQPKIESILPQFLSFIEGSILVAHNAEFDMSFLTKECQRQGYQLHWPSFCTLKMARALLPDLESKNLDSLARHFNLTFESRHRSIGDVKVTTDVLKALLTLGEPPLKSWADVTPYSVSKS